MITKTFRDFMKQKTFEECLEIILEQQKIILEQQDKINFYERFSFEQMDYIMKLGKE